MNRDKPKLGYERARDITISLMKDLKTLTYRIEDLSKKKKFEFLEANQKPTFKGQIQIMKMLMEA